MGRGIVGRGHRRKRHTSGELPLTSMMDVLTIIVVFLLKSYNVSMNNFSTSKDLQLPLSSSKFSPNDSLQVIVTPESMTVDDEHILNFVAVAGETPGSEPRYQINPADLDEGNRRIVPLYDALMKARDKTELLLAKSKARVDGKPIPFEGILAIQADKRVKYDVIRRVMYTSGAAGFKTFRFLAMKREA